MLLRCAVSSPSLSEVVNGQPLHYLDNGASGANAACSTRRCAQVRDDWPSQCRARRARPRRARDRGLRKRARRSRDLSRRPPAGNRIHRWVHGGDQPRRLFPRLAAEDRGPHPAVGAGAPLQHRAVAAPAFAQRHRTRCASGYSGRPHRRVGIGQAGHAQDQAGVSRPRVERHGRLSRREEPWWRRRGASAPRSCSTGPSAPRTVRSTCRLLASISMSSPGTRPTARTA